MNKERRERLDVIRWRIEDIAGEEQNYLDNMPEGIAESDKGDKSQEIIDTLNEAIECIERIIE